MADISNPQVTQLPSVATEISALESSGYDLNMLKYPQEVGGPDVPSYITFNIYVPTTSEYQADTSKSSSTVQSASQINSDYLKSVAGKPQQLGGAGGPLTASTIGVTKAVTSYLDNPGGAAEIFDAGFKGVGAGAASGAFSGVANKLVTLKPAIRRIAQSVSIYMPDTVNMQMQHDYKTVSATEAMGTLGQASAFGAQLSSAFHGLKSVGMDRNMLNNMGYNAQAIFQQLPAALQQLAQSSQGIELLGKIGAGTGLVGNDWGALALRSAGVAVNPQVEMLYTGTQNRSFNFLFRFQPRSQQESQVIAAIIQVFKFFSSPAIQPNTFGRFFVVPGQFDITFNFGQAVNPFISKISTCVLTNINVNYNPSDHWATMVDGAPPDIELQLTFMEAEIIYQQLMVAPDGSTQNQGF